MDYSVGEWVVADTGYPTTLPYGTVHEILGWTFVPDGNVVYTLKDADGVVWYSLANGFRKQSRLDFFKDMDDEELAEFKRHESAKKAEVQMMEKELKYKVGDKVRVRKDLELGKKYKMEGGIRDDVTLEMLPFAGEVVTITSCGDEYYVEEVGYFFTDDMLDGLAEEDEVAKEVDMVNHPPHYQNGGIETLDIIRMCMSKKEFKGYLKGQVIKYRERAQFKGNPEQDYAKARFYYDRLMELESEKKSKKRGKK